MTDSSPEIFETSQRLKAASEAMTTKAASLKETADALAAEVAAMAAKIEALESNNVTVADDLAKANEAVAEGQAIQDGRLDTLETNGNGHTE